MTYALANCAMEEFISLLESLPEEGKFKSSCAIKANV